MGGERLVPRLTPEAGIAGRLAGLAERVQRLAPDWSRPERFYEQRSEIAGELRRVAAEAAPPVPPRA